MEDELWDAKRVGQELNPSEPLTAASARKEMQRAGIKSVRITGYPAELVRLYKARRRGRGFRSDLHKED